MLYLSDLQYSGLCSYCEVAIETIEHLFLEYLITLYILDEIERISEISKIRIKLDKIFG